ncbi:DNA-(apurinic or apyrimidinic site) lyase 2-like [Varroa jacobsoni]|uniref:DNA-(apurinic or apyrimidinic site) lyase 2-like n=1 Tax=Varroa jacobsoni TaxID=62625 RepID=UPI000BF3676F|nr:DNA-(apurinic or apyrimidinic site) lyase 2-like [Varroa jacobsoni]XP_022711129.1 DNA-(apurinic or apyrimidinic site) lyase 2-like [Varroa jacobsoni]XP_022711130.1 DNA-(apurinic or apyrimidinic site) lyase 2-like [Varroa jacobsoni]XP_022711131.1 DNA-(apurinic or apyrimidinic site) lyase 2-like [Varroa jacobsoni]XP_022711132.1 DNA-(apurinic or apyrimidinic site) lyase 2-like [Varroa jacobsoni]
MKIVTWNINGLRTFKGFLRETLDAFKAEVICFQETRTNRSTLESDLACVSGYNSYFAFPRALTGYSGVATFSSDKLRPFAVNELLQRCTDEGIEAMDMLMDVPRSMGDDDPTSFIDPKEIANIDSEGRCIALLYKFSDKNGGLHSLVIFNLYCPRNDPDRPERAEFKRNFNAMLEHQARNLVTKGYHVILAGDMNISHKRIDNCDPSEEFESAPERIWMSKLLDRSQSVHFVDVFRHFHPFETEQYTCWNSQKSARVTNFGTRIDYIISDAELIKYFTSCDIHADITGSDHCPVSAVLNINLVSAEKVPKKCTRFWPEFSGIQTSLKVFLVKTSPTQSLNSVKNGALRKRPAETQSKLNAFFVKKYKHSLDDQKAGVEINSADAGSQAVSLNTSNEAHKQELEATSKTVQRKAQLNSSWKNILKGPPSAPTCSGHGETSVMRIVKKDGPNKGRKFFCCARPEGAASNKEARCQFFVWI